MSYLRDIAIVKNLGQKLDSGNLSDELCQQILNEVESKLRLIIQVKHFSF